MYFYLQKLYYHNVEALNLIIIRTFVFYMLSFTVDEKAQLEGTVKELAAELTGILFPNTKSASEFNTAFKSANISSFPHRLAGILLFFNSNFPRSYAILTCVLHGYVFHQPF